MTEDLVFRIVIEGATKEAEELSKLEVQLARLRAAYAEQIAIGKKQGTLTQEQAKQAGLLKVQINDLAAVKNRLTQSESNNARAATATSGSMNELRARTAALRQELGSMDIMSGKNAARQRELQREISANTVKIRDFDRAISGNNTLVGEYSRGFVDAFKKIGIAVFAVYQTITRISRAVTQSLAAFSEFEQGQLAVQGLLQSNNDQLYNESLQLMQQYGLAIGDVNKALFDAVSAGVDAGQSQAFLAEAAKLSIGGVTTLTVAVDGLTSVMNAYGLETSEAERVAAAFFSAQKFGKTTVEELAGEVGKISPLAKQLNVTYQEQLSILAELTKQGISTQDASTALKNVFATLLKPAAENEAVFKKLGIAYGAAGVSQAGFLNVFKQVIDATESGNVELAEIFPNIRALTGAGALTTEAWADMHEILKVVNDDWGAGSSAARAYALQMEGTKKQTDILKQTFTAIRVEIGERLSPVIEVANRFLTYFKGNVLGLTQATTSEAQSLARVNAEIQTNLRVLNDANLSADTRKRLIADINSQYGQYLPRLLDEKDTMADIVALGKETNQNIFDRILLMQYEEEIAQAIQNQKTGADIIYKAEVELAKLRAENSLVAMDNAAAAQLQVNLLLNAIEAGQAFIEAGQTGLEEIYARMAAVRKRLGLPDPETGKRPGADVVTPQAADTDTKDAERRAKELAAALLAIQRELAAAEVNIIQDKEGKAIAAAILRYDTEVGLLRQRAVEFPEIQGEIDALLELKEIEHQQALNVIQEQYRDERAKGREKEQADIEAARVAELTALETRIQRYAEGISAMADIFEAGKQRELSAAGQDAEKREAIERKYARRRQIMQAAQVIANTALAYISALATVQPTVPAGAVAAKWVAAMGALQLAAVLAQKYETGGRIKPGNELPGSRAGTDNTLILARPGEVVLNESQQMLAGGADFFRRLGVPGFATGGVPVPDTGTTLTTASTSRLMQAIQRMRVMLQIHELNAALKESAIINKTSEL